MLALALIGIGDTLYLAWHQYLNLVPGCALSGCEVVLTSPLSKLFGIPLSYYGLVYFTYLFALAALLIYDPSSRGLRLAALIYTGLGTLYFAHALLYVQAVLIGAFCQYCIIAATTNALAFGAAIWHWRSPRV